ncbi:MAG: hypothetical protein MK102_03040 [Fuerstiella sp.]|nr:hypothetical protein [Fuerstiella sp.]
MNQNSWELPQIPIGTDSWWVFAVVLVALMIFIWVTTRLVTRATEDSDPAEIDRQMLTAVNDLHRKGDLSQKEFRSIKGQLVDRLKRDQESSSLDSSDGEDCEDVIESTAKPAVSSSAENHGNVFNAEKSGRQKTNADHDIPISE